ncbi:MAG: response regulator transcription factor [Bryobacteraceae bacterium]|jgi:DNA-binding response OmpR family regulator
MKRQILVVEDDVSLAGVLCDNLVYEGFEVALATDGDSALEKAGALQLDLVLLDLMLPKLSGMEVCRRLPPKPSRPGLIIITARDQKEDRLQAFQMGADDYVTKPFSLDELLARVHAVLRRLHPIADYLVLGQLKFDFRSYSAVRGAKSVSFTQQEMKVLHYMSDRTGKLVTRNELLQFVWGFQSLPRTRCVDNVIARLRLKIEEDVRQPRYLRTVHGAGYRLTPGEHPPAEEP